MPEFEMKGVFLTTLLSNNAQSRQHDRFYPQDNIQVRNKESASFQDRLFHITLRSCDCCRCISDSGYLVSPQFHLVQKEPLVLKGASKDVFNRADKNTLRSGENYRQLYVDSGTKFTYSSYRGLHGNNKRPEYLQPRVSLFAKATKSHIILML